MLVYLFVLKREIHKAHVGGIAQLQRNIDSGEQSEKKFINQCSWHDKNMLGKESGAEGNLQATAIHLQRQVVPCIRGANYSVNSDLSEQIVSRNFEKKVYSVSRL